MLYAWIETKKGESLTSENIIQGDNDSITGDLFWPRFGFDSRGSVSKQLDTQLSTSTLFILSDQLIGTWGTKIT